MGVSRDSDPPRTFSDDILCIELCGPDQEHLSVIDIPGIFKKVTDGVTTKGDIQMVKSMVQDHMDNSRSVILCVCAANIDVANQEILDMASDIDEEGKRTLGILTKPDLVDHGAEQDVMDLVEDRKHKLNLGWHLVKNPSQQQLLDTTINRHLVEENFFKQQIPYNKLDEDKVGISALKIRLQGILTTLTRREFPKVSNRNFTYSY